jgi:hypothetical protein
MTEPARVDVTAPERAVLSRAELRDHLVRYRIAGQVATAREVNLRSYRMIADREPHQLLGLQPERAWTAAEVLDLMVRRCGVSPDPAHRYGVDTIDPDLTLDALDRFADRLAAAVAHRERVLVATGHPAALLGVHLRLAAALRVAGCAVVEAGADWSFEAMSPNGRVSRAVQFIGGVGVVQQRGSLVHTHSALPIRAVLGELATAGEPLPQLVVADHGWAGGAGQAGIDAIGFADCNDPALFVGEAEGRLSVTVPLDDGIAPRRYEPMTDYLIARANLRGSEG